MGEAAYLGWRVRRLIEHSPCYRPIVVYYFQSAREKRAGSSRDRRRDEAEVSGASDGSERMRQINTAPRFTSRVTGLEL